MNILVSNNGLLDTSFNLLFRIDSSNSLKYFGGCIYLNKIYFNCKNNLCSIDLDYKNFKIEIFNIDYGTHYILIKNNYLYIQETYYNQIKRYYIDNSGNIDLKSGFICPIYDNSLNPNLVITEQNNTNNDNYRHINSLCFVDELPDYLLCTSSFLRNGPIINNLPTNINTSSTIDYINLNDWTYKSYDISEYGIHDLTYFNKNLYYLGQNSINMFDPIKREYIKCCFKYNNIDFCENTISRGLWFDNNFAYFYITPIISRNGNISKSDWKIISLKIDINNWELIEEIFYDDLSIFSKIK